jgi:hypothetical protein
LAKTRIRATAHKRDTASGDRVTNGEGKVLHEGRGAAEVDEWKFEAVDAGG